MLAAELVMTVSERKLIRFDQDLWSPEGRSPERSEGEGLGSRSDEGNPVGLTDFAEIESECPLHT